MAISLLLLARGRAATPLPSPVGTRYGYGTSGRQRWLSAALSLGIAGGVGAALVAALVVPQITERLQGPIIARPIPLPQPIDPIIEPQPQAPEAPADSVITIPRPQIDVPPLGNPPIGEPDLGLALPAGPLIGEGTGSGGSLTMPEIIETPTPVFRDARRDPRFARSFQPAYPPALEREGVVGTARVRVRIGTDGRVISVEDLGATDPAFFTATQRQALRHWRFVPATRDGVDVESEQILTVRFEVPPRD